MVDYLRPYNPFPGPSARGQADRADRPYLLQPATGRTLYRGWDTGSGGRYVTWTAATLTPLATQTTPNYTGSLIDAHVEIP